jgi:uncharacterized delta-60 repeat protein
VPAAEPIKLEKEASHEGHVMRDKLKYQNPDTVRLMPRALRETRWGLLAASLLLPVAAFSQDAGDLDPSFGGDGKVLTDFNGSNDEGYAAAIQPDGKIIVVGYVSDPATGLPGFGVARYLPDGSLDATFGGDGRVVTEFEGFGVPQAVAIQEDGRIVVGGYTPSDVGTSFALARYLPNGALDVTFDGDGKLIPDIAGGIYDLLLQPDGKIIATGSVIARFLPDGTLDATFGGDGVVASIIEQFSADLQSDGKIVTAGLAFDSVSEQYRFAVARYLADGTVDTSFDVDGRVITDAGGSGYASSVALQLDGKIVAAGHVFNVATSQQDFALVRYLPDGTLDSTFSGDGRLTTDFGASSGASAVALQRDGKIVAAGGAASTFALARYLPNGTLDTTFDDDGRVTTSFSTVSPGLYVAFASDLVIQPDAKLVAVGAVTETGEGGFDFALARYESGLAPPFGPPTTVEACKHNGWRTFNIPRVFKSQGDCIQFVNTGS